MLSLVPLWMWGALLGLALGALNLAFTAVAPVAEPHNTFIIAAAILGIWTMIGFAAERRRFRIWDSVRAGLVAAVLGHVISSAADLLRKVLFLDILQHRSDWQELLARFHESGSTDLRSFIISEHLQQFIRGTVVVAIVGALCGWMGGKISVSRRAAGGTFDDAARMLRQGGHRPRR